MSDLRPKIIEAVAQSLAQTTKAFWTETSDAYRAPYRSAATSAVDAMLDCLEANATELRDNIDVAVFHVSTHQINALIAALRDSDNPTTKGENG